MLSGLFFITRCGKDLGGILGPSKPLKAISNTQACFFYFPDFSQIVLDKNSPPLLEGLEQMSIVRADLERAKALFGQLSRAKTAVALSFQIIAPGKIGSTWIMDLGRIKNSEGLFDQLDWSIEASSQFKGQKIYLLRDVSNTIFAFSQYDNLVLLAKHPYQIEEAIVQLVDNKGAVTNSSKFRSLLKGRDRQAMASLFLNTAVFADFNSTLIKREYRQQFEQLSQSFSWYRLDFGLQEQRLSVEGTVMARQQEPLLFSTKTNSSAFDRFAGLLPDNLISFRWHTFQDPKVFLGTSEGPFQVFFSKFTDGELAFVQTGEGWNKPSLLLHFNDENILKEALDVLGDQSGIIQEYHYQTYFVRQLLEENLFSTMLVRSDLQLKNPYVVVLEDHILFSASKSTIELWIDQYIIDKTLQQQDPFLMLKRQTQKPLQHFYYLNTLESQALVQETFTDGENDLQVFWNWLTQRPAYLGLQLNQSGDFHLFQQQLSARAQLHQIRWKYRLEAPAVISPQVIQFEEGGNHFTLIQDKKDALYLIDSNGQVLWKKQLDARILSDFFLLDFYNSGENYLLFNTQKRIHLLDPEGKSVGLFPIDLLSEASNGMQKVDFSGVGEFGFFVACENEHIYGFDRRGRPLPGWNPMRETAVVRKPLVHFQFRGKDHIAVFDEQRVLHIFRRDGTRRFSPQALEETVGIAPAYQISEKTARMVLMHPDNKASIWKPDGEVFQLQLPGEQNSIDFEFADICGDDRYDYLNLQGQQLQLSYYEGQSLKTKWRKSLPFQVDEVLVLSPSGKEAFIGLVDADKQQIYLRDKDGNAIDGFPLAGNRAFELFSTNSSETFLVASNNATLYCYELEL